jgi:hypothetical protein
VLTRRPDWGHATRHLRGLALFSPG